MTGPLVLLDSASLYFRSFYALPDSLTAPDGTVVNAVKGFTDTIARILNDRKPSRLVACMDADWRPAFRVNALPTYKTHRVADPANNVEEIPDILTPQVPIILEVLDAFGFAVAEAEGYEADDVIGTLAHRESKDPVEVITGDRDLFQVVRHEPTPASVVYVGRGWAKAEVIGPRELAAKYDLPSENTGIAYADMALLRGDPSDGLPGVAGIGEKTAARLMVKYGSLEGLLAAAAADPSDVALRVRSALTDAADYVAAAPLVVRVALDAEVVQDRDDRVPAEARDLDRVRELQETWDLGASIDRLLAALPG
ncbi:5'-3' exonuclease [Actinophytocola algeriensis]|uniref:5'-3' exonuclease n=1 Tax=Actinophytocola algeriensis TaxID=1768010 RepID=A0A7W7Q2C4_9PSEU|nr:5'-3' exonuclease H3TH domain-containing protein [Actinophytocola algeriensis]MBB4905677.1 5'-3' exonuclease [Actinophytocola algeriensis]MBE1472638.1 5'-3' exonuclease [Actinophytocola algeriensis]